MSLKRTSSPKDGEGAAGGTRQRGAGSTGGAWQGSGMLEEGVLGTEPPPWGAVGKRDCSGARVWRETGA